MSACLVGFGAACLLVGATWQATVWLSAWVRNLVRAEVNAAIRDIAGTGTLFRVVDNHSRPRPSNIN